MGKAKAAGIPAAFAVFTERFCKSYGNGISFSIRHPHGLPATIQ
jgi:hypothetical protein